MALELCRREGIDGVLHESDRRPHWSGLHHCRGSQRPELPEDRLALAAPAVEQYLAHWRIPVENLSAELRGVRHLFAPGRGSSLAATGIGGMIMKEAAHFHITIHA